MRSKVFKVVMVMAAVTGILALSVLMTASVTAKGDTTSAGNGFGAVLPPEFAGGQYAEAYQKHELIRFHVIANSDSNEDQALKRKIRDLIVQQMTPEFAKAGDLQEARAVAQAHLADIKTIAASEARAWGKNYPVSVQLGKFDFPIKSYGELTLPAGSYEAVRVVIGRGQGANWWCVLFPPLCFVDVSRSFGPQEIMAPGSTGESRGQNQPVYQVRFKILDLLGRSARQ